MKSSLLLTAALLAGPVSSFAQSFSVTGLLPARNATAAPRVTNVGVTFSQPLNPSSVSALRVFSQQGGRVAGSVIVNGNTLTFDPLREFRPGETVRATLTATAQGNSGSTLASPQVFQFTTAALGGTGIFNGGSELLAGNGPLRLILSDVDNDGDLDVLAPNSSGNTVSVRLNDGRGEFSGGSEVTVASGPLSVATLDADGDGDLDLLTANANNSSVSVRLNNGNGSFSVPPVAANGTVAVGHSPQVVVPADVDGDGDLDFLVTNYQSLTGGSSVSVRLNNGAGVFSNGSEVVVGNNCIGLAVGDLDSDGDVDLLTANVSTGTVSIRFNDGRGLFTGTVNVPVGTAAQGIALADIDADGDLDFLVANDGALRAVNVRLNNGLGTFSAASDVPVGDSAQSLALADVDGDGDLDILASSTSTNAVSVRLNNGSGQFSLGVDAPVGGYLVGLTAGDIDGDGDLDLVASVANSANGAISVRLNNGTGTPLATAAGRRATRLALYPNPARSETRVEVPAGTRQVSLLSALGQTLRTLAVAPAATEVSFPLVGLPGGVYFVQAGTEVSRLVIE